IGGALGYFVGVILANALLGGGVRIPMIRGPLRTIMLVSAAIALVVGFVFRSFKVLHERLRTREWAERELEIARSIQTRLLPPAGAVGVANAGCPDPYTVNGHGVEFVHCDGIRLPLGIRSDVDYSTTTRRLDPGSRLLLLSDGIPEASIAEGQPLGYEALQQI